MGVRVRDWRVWMSEYETTEYGCLGTRLGSMG